MSFETLMIVLFVVCVIVWVALSIDIIKYPENVPEKCKFCQWRWECRGDCIRDQVGK